MNKLLPAFLFWVLLVCNLQGLHAQQTFTSSDQVEEHIRQLQQTVQNKKLTTKELSPGQAHLLPIAILNNSGDKPAILIDDITFYPTYAEFRAYAAIQLPGAKEDIYFATVEPVKLSFNGGLLNVARMKLVQDKTIHMGSDMSFTIQKGKSYLDFDCYGFLKAGLGIEVQLSSKLAAEFPDGRQDTSTRVKARFYTEITDLNDVIASVSIDPFQVRGVPDITFTVTDAVIDLSDFNNTAGMSFPATYLQSYYRGADISLWRGFYLRNVSVKLPPEIEDRSGQGRKEFGARNLLIDNHGLSGDIYAKNIISLQNGNLDGWSYSVDSLSIGFTANQLTGASLAGGLNIPISGDTQKLNYQAIFNPGKEYIFNVATTDKLQFNLFQASQVTLDAGSSVLVALRDKKFEAMANLNGRMSIGTSLSGKQGETNDANKFSIPGVRFEQLVISTKSPYLLSGVFDLDVPVKLGRFKSTINNIYIAKKDNRRGLGIDMQVGLMNTKDANNSFSADANLLILGEINTTTAGRQRYKYTNTDFSEIVVDINQGSFSLRGGLQFFSEDATFGSGFKGELFAGMQPGITVAATALFGNINASNYWYADAFAGFRDGIAISPMLQIDGFAGGLYYGVKQKPGSSGNIAIVNSQTGLAYLPDADAGLGVKAAVSLSISKNKKVCNGIVGLEVSFHKGGGLSRVSFMGNVNFMHEPSVDLNIIKVGSVSFSAIKTSTITSSSAIQNNSSAFDQMNQKGALSASILIDYDVDNRRLFANFEAFVNAANGTLKGTNAKGSAGQGILYFAPDTWHVLIGTPQNPIGLRIAGLADANSYFMVGENLPGSPPPPHHVSEILGGQDMDYMRDLNALNSGKGFAFGSRMQFDTGDLSCLIFYGHFAAGAGFDVMMKDYGGQATCEGGNGPVGINGWYANGQVYAFVEGKIGITLKLFGSKKDFDIFDVGAATILQAKLPNPTWMHGIVGGRYNIMGGMIKGNCRFELTIGKECKIIDTGAFAESGVQVIASVTPENTGRDVDVFAVPQAVFNIPVGESFSIKDANGRSFQFRSKLDVFSLTDGGIQIPGTVEWNADHTVLVFNTTDILPSQKDMNLTVKISFEENKNGSWMPYLISGKSYAEQVTNKFKTGVAPDIIPANNIAYSYPVNNQLNYYKNESKTGYIKLKKGQPYLFDRGNEFKQVVRLQSANGEIKEFDLLYTDNQVNFTMPDIGSDIGYEFAIVAVPKISPQAIDQNVKTEDQGIYSSDLSNTTLTTRKAEGSIRSTEEKLTFSMNFRSSKYKTLAEKLEKGLNGYSFNYFREGMNVLGYAFNSDEIWDDFEINSENNLISVEADMNANAWYDNHVYPYTYQNYPAMPQLALSWRDVSANGVPPLKAINTLNNNRREDLRYSLLKQPPAGKIGFEYQVAHFMERDYLNIQGKIANMIAGGYRLTIAEKMQQIVVLPFQPVLKGNYKMKIHYVLPGTGKTTSIKELDIVNVIGQ